LSACSVASRRTFAAAIVTAAPVITVTRVLPPL
jgi:hypothetical protein